MRRLALALALTAALFAPRGEAAPVTQTLNFIASGFGSGAPTDPVTGSVTFTYDPATPNVVVPTDSLSLTIGTTTYTGASVVGGSLLIVGSSCTSFGCAVTSATPGFAMSFQNWATPGIAPFTFRYSVGDGRIYGATSFELTSRATPVPAHLPLAVAGLLMLTVAALGRRGGMAPRPA